MHLIELHGLIDDGFFKRTIAEVGAVDQALPKSGGGGLAGVHE